MTDPYASTTVDDELQRALEVSLTEVHGQRADDNIDDDMRKAMAASLEEIRLPPLMRTTTAEAIQMAIAESEKYKYVDRAQQIVFAAGPLSEGRHRLCLEMPKGSGRNMIQIYYFLSHV